MQLGLYLMQGYLCCLYVIASLALCHSAHTFSAPLHLAGACSGQLDDRLVDIDLPPGDSSKKIDLGNGGVIMLDSIFKRCAHLTGAGWGRGRVCEQGHG